MKTMFKVDYLRLCAKVRSPLLLIDWYYKAFSIPEMIDEDDRGYDYLTLVKKPSGMHFKDEDGTLVKISDYVQGKPLFDPQETIAVDSDYMSNVVKPITSKIGNVLLNAVIIPTNLREKFPFLEGKLLPSDFTKLLEERVVNEGDPKTSDSISVEELVELFDNITFFSAIGDLVNIASTEKSITRAPGIDEFVKELVEKAGDNITDKVTLTEIEDKVIAFDKKYLEDDPVAQNLFSNKATAGRTKLYAMYGAGLDFINDSSNDTVVVKPVAEGIEPVPKSLVKYFNDLRYASFSRGDNTALAGVVYKDVQRALADILISPNACNTTKGLVKVMTKTEIAYSVGRYIRKGSKWEIIPNLNEAAKLEGKTVEMRSPEQCKTKGNSVCYACMSGRFKKYSNAISGMATAISDFLLHMFLKLMHNSRSVLGTINYNNLIN